VVTQPTIKIEMSDSCVLQFLNELASWHHPTQSNSVGALGQVSIVSHSYQTSFGFPGSNLKLDCGLCDHVITRFASNSVGAKVQVIFVSHSYET